CFNIICILHIHVIEYLEPDREYCMFRIFGNSHPSLALTHDWKVAHDETHRALWTWLIYLPL
ncbi:hypothetical protein ACJX0J_006879, partial [Zea mays]